MTKLPDNTGLMKLYREGFTDKEIAGMFDVTFQAVNKRLTAMGIRRAPYVNAATAIVEAAWPVVDTSRSRFTGLSRGRLLWCFLRWRLGDPGLSERQLQDAKRFSRTIRSRGVVMSLDPVGAQPWPYLPRQASDGQMVIRWPEDREKPTALHMEALNLPPVNEEE